MATFKIQDVHSVMQDLYRIVTKQDDIKVIDTTSFIDCGTKLLAQGYHNILDGLSVLVGETYYNNKKYTGKWRLAVKNAEGFAERRRKVSFYHRNDDPAGFVNTNLNPDNFYDGANASAGVGDMWSDMKVPRTLEQFWYSSNAYQEHITIFEAQLQDAFRSESEFLTFINNYMIEFENEVELRDQGRNQMVILNRIAANYLLKSVIPESAVNLRQVYKEWTGKNYSSKELYQEHLLDLLKTFVSKVQIDSDKLEYMTTLYHDPCKKNFDGVDEYILRFTPKSLQKMIFYSPIWRLAKNFNYAEIFNPSMIPEANGEGISSWMAVGTDVYDESMEVDWKPSLPADLGVESANVKIPMVLGLLFSDDAIAIRNTVERAATSPLEARKLYYQTWYSKRFSCYNDMTEQSILYYLEDEKASFTGDGVTTEFDLEAEEITGITVNGTAVDADAYTFEDGTITFTEAPADGAIIDVEYI